MGAIDPGPRFVPFPAMSDSDPFPSALPQAREYRVTFSGGSWFVRCIVAAVAAVVGVLMLVLLSGVLAIGLAVAIFLGLGVWIRSWFRKQRGPNGMLDGRRNVRVIDPRSAPPS